MTAADWRRAPMRRSIVPHGVRVDPLAQRARRPRLRREVVKRIVRLDALRHDGVRRVLAHAGLFGLDSPCRERNTNVIDAARHAMRDVIEHEPPRHPGPAQGESLPLSVLTSMKYAPPPASTIIRSNRPGERPTTTLVALPMTVRRAAFGSRRRGSPFGRTALR